MAEIHVNVMRNLKLHISFQTQCSAPPLQRPTDLVIIEQPTAELHLRAHHPRTLFAGVNVFTFYPLTMSPVARLSLNSNSRTICEYESIRMETDLGLINNNNNNFEN